MPGEELRQTMPGARKGGGFAVGRGLLPSPQEWAARNRILADGLAQLINDHARISTGRALDVGSQWGVLLDSLAPRTKMQWWGADPLVERHRTALGSELVPGIASRLPFPDATFDCAVLANVYEHIPPAERDASVAEIARVLVPGGVLVGQLPNPYFPIESHSKLPFMGWLPAAAQNWYWRISPSRRGIGFHSVTVGDLRRRASAAGFHAELIRPFNYPPEAAPPSVRWLVKLLSRPMRFLPWSWQFVLRR